MVKLKSFERSPSHPGACVRKRRVSSHDDLPLATPTELKNGG